jgi:hypothetical protein
MNVYNQTLGLNQQNYQNILGAYSGGQQNLSANLPAIYQGYGDLQKQIAGTLGQGGDWGVATPGAQAIAREFAKTQGNTQQQLINSGLGNTTVLGNLSNQNTLMAGQAYGGLAAQLAQTYAGYQSQLGMAGLGARMQGLGMQTGLSQAQGSTLGGYHFANTAGNLTGQQSTSQSSANNNQPFNPMRAGGGVGGGGGGGPGHIPFGYGGDSGGPGYSTFTQGTGALNPSLTAGGGGPPVTYNLGGVGGTTGYAGASPTLGEPGSVTGDKPDLGNLGAGATMSA